MLGVRPRDQNDCPLDFLVALIAILLIAGTAPAEPSTIDAISWSHDPSGRTIVAIVSSDPIESSSVRSYPIADPPRAVVVIMGITEPVKPGVLVINDPHINQLRLAHHEELVPPELNVILDLTGANVEILELRHDKTRISIVVGIPSSTAISTSVDPPTPTPSPVTPTPTVTPVVTMPAPSPVAPAPTLTPVVYSPTPTPVAPTPTPSPSAPTSNPSPTFAPSLTVPPSYPDRPAPPVLPTVVTEPTTAVEVTHQPPPVPLPFSSPTPSPGSEVATQVVDIAASPRDDRSTLLRITADGRLLHGSARYLEIVDDPPRIILTIRGISAPDLPRTMDIGDPNIDRIRLIQDAETSEEELHLVLHLNRAGISVTEMKQVGPHLVLQLSPIDQTPPTP